MIPPVVPKIAMAAALLAEHVLHRKHEQNTHLVIDLGHDHPAESDPPPDGLLFNQQSIVTSGGPVAFGLSDEAGFSGASGRMQIPTYASGLGFQDEVMGFSGSPSLFRRW